VPLRYNINERGLIVGSIENSGTYKWRIPTNETPGDKYQILLSSENNMFIISWSGFFTIEKNTTIADESYDDKIAIYPNPVQDELFIDFDNQFTGKTKISMFNMLGQLEFSNIYEISTNNNKIIIPLLKTDPGIYLLNIETNNTHSRKLVIKN
jgi:hypothetical protein